MELRFYKYHGTGNDFILFDSGKNDLPDRSKDFISWLCDRHFGIGADGVIVIGPAEQASADIAFKMVYYNSDGSEGTMCGNGGRCAVQFAARQGYLKDHGTFEASDGLHQGWVLSDGRLRITLNDVGSIEQLEDGYSLDTGSPHFVQFREDVESMDVFGEGRALRYDKRFPAGTNINFAEHSGNRLVVRTYERGVENETLSCGTGVTASAIAAWFHSQQQNSQATQNHHYLIQTRGGDLEVTFSNDATGRAFTDLQLTGPVTHVFTGTLEL